MSSALASEISQCTLCKDRFQTTATAHEPRPVVWFRSNPRILIAGQAPGQRVHQSGRPFTDPSGDRLRQWMGVGEETFYDRSRVAILPMAFCFPGYNAGGSDLPPPPICRKTWHSRAMEEIGPVPLTILVGGYAHKWHLSVKTNVTETTMNWAEYAPKVFPLPHPSWRNTGWIKRNQWFEDDLLPVLRRRVVEVLK